jgi:hypothetical protein
MATCPVPACGLTLVLVDHATDPSRTQVCICCDLTDTKGTPCAHRGGKTYSGTVPGKGTP